ncbi:MAG: hypothetical protein IJE71_02160 [Clostridia bacterium]|nr:hypothetical protein [Clostridia bacterium]
MSNPFKEDDLLLEGEWVEISDIEGRKAMLRHMATVGVGKKMYFVLGAFREGADEPEALMLVRKDTTIDGAPEYRLANDRHEIEHVVGHFVAHVLGRHLQEEEPYDDSVDLIESCGCMHLPGEFCFCDDPAYLQ